MILPRNYTLFVGLLSVATVGKPVLADFKIGDTVVVIHDTNIKVRDEIVQEVPRGVGLKVQDIRGDWLWVANEAAGWVHQRDVATPTEAIKIFTAQIKKDEYDSDAYIRRGLAFFDEQEVDLAIADLNEAIRLDPKNA